MPHYVHTYLLFWAEDTQVLLTSAVLEFGTFFLWVQEALEKKKKVTYSSISTSNKSILTEQDFHVVQFIITNIFVFKHCFRNLNV